MSQAVGILGGTFDPVHLGHLQLANQVLQQCALSELRLIPCQQSALKQQVPTSGEDRVKMLQLACADNPKFKVDSRELERGGISYSVDTLKSLRAELGSVPIYLIMSADAFAKFNLWHKWQEILELAHLVVANRPESQPPTGEILELLQQSRPGKILQLDVSPLNISATEIRNLIKVGKDASNLVPKAVWDYILAHKLYIKEQK